jgi:hypothetical protein
MVRNGRFLSQGLWCLERIFTTPVKNMLELKGEYYVEANLTVPGNSDKKPRRPLLLLSSSVTAN